MRIESKGVEESEPFKQQSNWSHKESANQLPIEHINERVHASIESNNLHDRIYKSNEKGDRINPHILHVHHDWSYRLELLWNLDGKDGYIERDG